MACKTGTGNSSQQHYSKENMLRIQKIYRNLFNNLERDTQGDLRKKELTALYYYKGRNYNGELLVVGRAVNGWTKESYRINQLKQQGVIRKIFEEIIPPKDDCLSDWVQECWENRDRKGYNTKRSAFWRTIKGIVNKSNISNEEDWASSIVWSNLYKISPFEGGNPSNSLCERTRKDCINILKAEIEVLNPRRIVFLTGSDWFGDFEEELEFKDDRAKRHPIEKSGKIFNGAQIVVLPHPQGKKEKPLIDSVAKHFQKKAVRQGDGIYAYHGLC
ncbi:hypothetical protein OpiT1DRAFT_02235 [Opitutaceae bacterium TAV1]|nr:hypothetical protein OpiT1DRAFT_02235 [Opitutaceae bacterium TAV1]